MSARDVQRAKVYAAEEFVRTLFTRAGEHSGRTLEFFGTSLTLPPEARFASLAAVRRYVEHVLALPAVREAWPQAPPVTVRARRGLSAAHYEHRAGEHRTGTGVIAVPEHTGAGPGAGGWALRELVVLHEIAHHLCPDPPAHGPRFAATMCLLAESVMGPEAGHVLRVVYAKEGVRLGGR
ncbi:MAG TPA: TIGR04338 family metallohydrolase [Mycolicibacillus parakoreensis]|nr:TIGR04338 family metallohydrolase [Mycolicibacillus parakoreensis]